MEPSRLNGAGPIVVQRGTDANGQSWILKWITREAPATRVAEFHYETQVMQFLQRHCPHFGAWPAPVLIQAQQRVMPDLGRSSYVSPSSYPLSLAHTMAALHRASQGQQAAFYRSVVDTGQQRKFSLSQCDYFVATGSALLRDIFAQLPETSASSLHRCVSSARQTIAAPGPLAALVHHDLAAARQWIVKPNGCFLLDFELAKYTHVLLDLARLQLGSWDKKRNSHKPNTHTSKRPEYHYQKPLLPPQFVPTYQNALCQSGCFPELKYQFQQHYQAPLLWTLLLNLGVLTQLQTRYYNPLSLNQLVAQNLSAYLELATAVDADFAVLHRDLWLVCGRLVG